MLFHSLSAVFLFDLQIVFVLVFLVIVPLCNPAGNLWNLIDEASNSGFSQDSVSHQYFFSVFAMTDSLTFSFCDGLSRLLISLAYIFSAFAAGFPPLDEESYREIFTFRLTVPITVLVSGLALSLRSDLITDIYIALSSILSAFLLCVF